MCAGAAAGFFISTFLGNVLKYPIKDICPKLTQRCLRTVNERMSQGRAFNCFYVTFGHVLGHRVKCRGSCLEVFLKIAVRKNINFPGKHIWWIFQNSYLWNTCLHLPSASESKLYRRSFLVVLAGFFETIHF